MDIYVLVIFIIMGGLTLWSFAIIIWFWKHHHHLVNAIAATIIATGVFGTFLGIYIGLQDFDTQNIEAIQGSISTLLDGLKVAFVTSIAGIGLSILIKFLALLRTQFTSATYTDNLAELLRTALAGQQEENKNTRESLRSIEKSLTREDDNTILTWLQKLGTSHNQDTLIDSFNEFAAKMAVKDNETMETLCSIEKSLTQEGEGTVLTQLQKLGTSDKQDALIDSFNEFAAKMADDNTNALIRALEEVMKDFNAKINEQFGDNFKQLNEAVGRVNQWQEQYRQQMNELAEEFRVAAESVEQSRESLAIIADRSGAIVASAEQLSPTLQALKHQVEHFENHLEAFGALADNARNAFPIIENRLDQLTSGFSNSVNETINNSQDSMQKQRKAIDGFLGMVKESIENSHRDMERQRSNLQDFTERIDEVIRSTSSGLENTLEETNRGLQITLQSQSSQLNAEVQRIFAESAEHMKRQIEHLDDALKEELTKALNLSGSELANLSQKFVEDYSPLTDRLREVVQIARQLPPIPNTNTSDDIPF